MFYLLRTYVILLCNWLILWQSALYLYLGRSRICLILQEICCSSLVLKLWRLDQETSEEKLFIKARQIAWHLRTDSSITAQHLSTVARHLSIAGGSIEKAPISLTAPRYLLDSYICWSLKLDTFSTPLNQSRLREFRFPDLIFGPSLCICVGFYFLQP